MWPRQAPRLRRTSDGFLHGSNRCRALCYHGSSADGDRLEEVRAARAGFAGVRRGDDGADRDGAEPGRDAQAEGRAVNSAGAARPGARRQLAQGRGGARGAARSPRPARCRAF